MLAVGIFTFPLFYLLGGWLVADLLDLKLPGILLYFLSLPLSGFFTLHYWSTFRHTQEHLLLLLLLRLFVKRQDLLADLKQQRQEIMSELETAKNDYVDYVNTTL